MFAIPTNRLVSPSARSLLQEMQWLREMGTDPEELVILDNSTEAVVRHNARDLARLRQETLISLHHVTAAEQLRLIDALAREAGEERGVLRDLLYPEPNVGDYGKVFNLLYLLAVARGRRVLHRRDSDCTTEGRVPGQYPVAQERLFLGQTLARVASAVDTLEALPLSALHKEVLIAGSDYIGHWNLDVMELPSHHAQAMPALLQALSVPSALIPDYLHAKYRGRNEEARPRPLLITCEGGAQTPEITPHYPECGNLAMKDIFRRIPNFIGRYCIGFDYHTYILGTMLGVPAVYHRNKLVHAHDAVRRRRRDVTGYWRGIAKLADYNHLITEVARSEAFTRLAAQTAPEGAALAGMIEACHDGRRWAERRALIDALAEEVLLPAREAPYVEAAHALQRTGDALLEELDQDYRRSLALQRLWPACIRAADTLARAETLPRWAREAEGPRISGLQVPYLLP